MFDLQTKQDKMVLRQNKMDGNMVEMKNALDGIVNEWDVNSRRGKETS